MFVSLRKLTKKIKKQWECGIDAMMLSIEEHLAER